MVLSWIKPTERQGIIAFWILIFFVLPQHGYTRTELRKYTSCNAVIDMEFERIQQAELELIIRASEDSSRSRVSCDIKILAGMGHHVMFYFVDLYLGSPNKTESRIDRACIEPRDFNDPYESTPKGMRPIICSRTDVGIGDKIYATDGSGLFIRFYRNRGYSITAHLKLVFTAFRKGSCRTSERKCNNDRCIAHEIVCNDWNPCGDYSDCPTGLEHLSSLQMSGIVVLALLSGGIIIIMAAVCLQRVGSKRYELDDLPIPANGNIPQDHGHTQVELNDVRKSSRRYSPSNSDKSRRPPSERGSQLYLHNRPTEKELLFQNYNCSSLDQHSGGGDREMLIKTPERRSDSFSDELMLSERDSCITTLALNDASSPDKDFRRSNLSIASLNTKRDRQMQPFSGVPLLVPDDIPNVQRPNSLPDAFHLSAHSLVFSDSDSGTEEDKFNRASYDNNRTMLQQECFPLEPMASSASHNGSLSRGAHSFRDFKPPPPPYGSLKNKPSVIERLPNDVIATH